MVSISAPDYDYKYSLCPELYNGNISLGRALMIVFTLETMQIQPISLVVIAYIIWPAVAPAVEMVDGTGSGSDVPPGNEAFPPIEVPQPAATNLAAAPSLPTLLSQPAATIPQPTPNPTNPSQVKSTTTYPTIQTAPPTAMDGQTVNSSALNCQADGCKLFYPVSDRPFTTGTAYSVRSRHHLSFTGLKRHRTPLVLLQCQALLLLLELPV